ncbi:polysaccharide deacetylase family protein [Stappia sp. ES.058]|uniref:polysaccharide deacetylase family protein n=1 Tax=Stappia sp. ES.058 TaxID=1881061 RepID=UPI0012FD5397|nr:polysaccharide deacetylase family protein [Stappia sp. ES.058]
MLATGCRVLHASGLGRLLAPLTGGRGLVFTLHSVRPDAETHGFSPNRHLTVTPEFLESTILQARAAGLRIVSLAEALDHVENGDPDSARVCAFTFDDGYRDNLIHAYPVLRKHGVPFTIFVTSGFVDRTSEIWWEALERIVRGASFVETPIGARMRTLDARNNDGKTRTYDRLLHWFTHELGEESQRVELRRLAAVHGVDLVALADELILDWDELRVLCRDPLFTVGAHTHNHFALARLSRARMHDDIAAGMDRLAAELGISPHVFAYPYGFEAAVNHQSLEVVSQFGFRAAFTTHAGMLDQSADPFAMPRVSLNGYFQNRAIVSQYLNGSPFPIYNALRRIRDRISFRQACP